MNPTVQLTKMQYLLAAVSCSLWLAGCGGSLGPILQIQDAPAIVASGQQESREGVRAAVLRALASNKWLPVREGSDGIVAKRDERGMSATVHIQFSERTYSIRYVDSSPSMKFDGTMIRTTYNSWIHQLSRSIYSTLAVPVMVDDAAQVPATHS